MVVLRSGVIRERDSDGLSLHLFLEDVDLGEESNHGRVNKDFGIDDFGEEFQGFQNDTDSVTYSQIRTKMKLYCQNDMSFKR